ncbi:MAG: hypothetical protein KF849_09235 [Rhizobiaceae bacterium]|nr:hypothetical protein [Rhizobiaceae bacterium]
MTEAANTKRLPAGTLSELRNVGKATLADFRSLGIETVADLAMQTADDLYQRLCRQTGHRHDPCVHDVFSATIHQAKTREALDWWNFTAARKARPFPTPPAPSPRRRP